MSISNVKAGSWRRRGREKKLKPAREKSRIENGSFDRRLDLLDFLVSFDKALSILHYQHGNRDPYGVIAGSDKVLE